MEEYVEASNEAEGMGAFFMCHPSIRFNDVLDYEFWEI